MTLDFTGLADLAKAPAKAVPGWQPLTLDDLGYGSAVCWDQSLTATGCVILFRDREGLVVHSASKWVPPGEGDQGILTSLKRGTDVFRRARAVIEVARSLSIDGYVHESPPHPGKVKGGGTSSLQAAQALHCAADAEGVQIEMLGAQPGKRLVCGNAAASKPEAHAALKLHCFPWIQGAEQVTNEATRDALIVGLLWLARRK